MVENTGLLLQNFDVAIFVARHTFTVNNTGTRTTRDNVNSVRNQTFRNWRLIGVAVLLFCCGVLLFLSIGPGKPNLGPGPIYNGISVTAWIDSIQTANGDDPAITNLINVGSPAVPYLARAALWKPSLWDQRGSVVWRYSRGIADRLHVPPPINPAWKIPSRKGAMYVLGQLGPSAKDALPAMRSVSREPDWGIRTFALSAIASIGPEPKDVPLLVEALSDKQPPVRMQAARCLGKLGPQAKEAIEVLKKALHDDNSGVREFASTALGKIDPNPLAQEGVK